ncbi:MAG: cell division topological specificity factor MinE [Pseudanabaenaceae cyanobacterium bins.39]|nr:cell division topological specificity factor MinE [Pseudanabaenaceae cyanobacterium bins.39]
MISTLLDRLFQRSNVPSGAKVKQRLKFILAHDRAAIEPQVFDNMRHEIMRVVSKYVELDEGSLDIRLESDKRMTALIANLPIRTVREELPDLVNLFDVPEDAITVNSESSDLALEMDRSADAALDAIAIQSSTPPHPNTNESLPVENAETVADRTTEVSHKLRLAANKSQPDINQADATVDVSVTSSENLSGEEQPSDAPIDENEQVQPNDPTLEQDHDQLELTLNLPQSPQLPANLDETPSDPTQSIAQGAAQEIVVYEVMDEPSKQADQ